MRSLASVASKALAILVVVGIAAGCVQAPGDDPAVGTVTRTPADLSVRADGLERTLRDATLRVRNRGCTSVGTGTGFAIEPRLLVTNRHVIQGADTVQVSSWDGQSIEVHINAVAVSNDLAIVETVEELPRTLELGSSPAPGAPVTAVGYPSGGAFTMAPGRVLGYVPGTLFGEAADTMVISNRVEPGNSGGPLVDDDGRATGVIFAIELASGNGLAIPIETLLDIADQRGFFSQPAAC